MIGEHPTIISAKDVKRSLQFYRSVLGFDLAYRWPSEGPIEYAFLKSREITVWIVAEEIVERLRRTSLRRRDSEKLTLCIEVEDVAATVDRLVRKGENLASSAVQQPEMERGAVFEDPDGNLIYIQPKRRS